jgi:hypothetical protein
MKKELTEQALEYVSKFTCPPQHTYCSHDILAAYKAGVKAGIKASAHLVLTGGFHVARRNAAKEVMDLLGVENDWQE